MRENEYLSAILGCTRKDFWREMEHYERELVWFGGDIRSKVKALGKLANAARRAIGTARGFAELLVTQQVSSASRQTFPPLV